MLIRWLLLAMVIVTLAFAVVSKGSNAPAKQTVPLRVRVTRLEKRVTRLEGELGRLKALVCLQLPTCSPGP